jgi:predicted dehydrogenase
MIRVGVCGFGYWGPKLVRAFSSNPAFRVAAVADIKAAARDRAHELGPAIRVYGGAEELIVSPEIDAIAIATPVLTHYPLALRALKRGKHVLVEKPMCASADEGRELVAVADRMKRTLMVDHPYIFHGAVHKLKELKVSGALGKITYYDSLRVNLGLFQPDMNVLWDLAPHDFSILSFIVEEQPVYVEATGYCHVNPNLPDIVYITLHYASRIIAHLNLSWMSPVKARRIAFGGTKQMVVWNDLDPDEKVKIYDSGI